MFSDTPCGSVGGELLVDPRMNGYRYWFPCAVLSATEQLVAHLAALERQPSSKLALRPSTSETVIPVDSVSYGWLLTEKLIFLMSVPIGAPRGILDWPRCPSR